MTETRTARYRRYLDMRRALMGLSAADLQDIGIRSWQIGPIARRMALGRPR
jgi:uncharacterized protein YjiS (DUF1127 family)